MRGLHLVSGPWQCNSSSVPALPPSLLLSPSLIRQAAVCAAELRCKFLFSDRRMPMGPLNSLIPRRIKIHHFFFFFLHPIYYPHTTLVLLPSSNSDLGSHSEPFSHLPTTVRALNFYRKNNSAFSSLVDSRRIVPTHAAKRSQQLIHLLHFCKYSQNLATVGIEP